MSFLFSKYLLFRWLNERSVVKRKAHINAIEKKRSGLSKKKLGFIWPVEGKIISHFGVKAKGLRNDGVNIKAGRGTAVRAAETGVVVYAGNELRGFGKLLLVKHVGGWITAYAHNNELLVKRGQKLKRGQKIATVGSTGNVSTPQLHFEIRLGKVAKNPKRFVKRKV